MRPIVVCGCGLAYTVESWAALDFVGYMADEVETLELRNCPCGSTRAIVLKEHIMTQDHFGSFFVRAINIRMEKQHMTMEAAVRDFIKQNPENSFHLAEELGLYPSSEPVFRMFQDLYNRSGR